MHDLVVLIFDPLLVKKIITFNLVKLGQTEKGEKLPATKMLKIDSNLKLICNYAQHWLQIKCIRTII